MNVSTDCLEGISLVWWPALLQAEMEAASSIESLCDVDSFTATLQNLANALRCAELGDLEEITLP